MQIVAPAPVGGLESVVRALSLGLAGRGHDVHLLAIVDAIGTVDALLAPLRAGGVTVHEVAIPARAYRFERSAVRARLAAVSPAVIHSHGYRTDVVDSGVARQLGVPVVTTVHGFTGGGLKNRVYEFLQVRAFRRMDRVVAVSRPLERLLARRGVPRDRLRIIVNAWAAPAPALPRAAARRALGIPNGAARIGWVGRLTREKGADVLVDALAHIPGAVGASIVGGGREREALAEQARARGVADRITWHGVVPDASRCVSAFDALVISSRTEGTPMVLFEAMAAGVPIVTTSVGGIPDVVGDAEALLVPPEDPRALAGAVERVFDDPADGRLRATAASAALRRFETGPWLAAYEALYREISAEEP